MTAIVVTGVPGIGKTSLLRLVLPAMGMRNWRRPAQVGYPQARTAWFKCQGCHSPESLVWSEDCKIRGCCGKDNNLIDSKQCSEFPRGPIIAFEKGGDAGYGVAVNRPRELKESIHE